MNRLLPALIAGLLGGLGGGFVAGKLRDEAPARGPASVAPREEASPDDLQRAPAEALRNSYAALLARVEALERERPSASAAPAVEDPRAPSPAAPSPSGAAAMPEKLEKVLEEIVGKKLSYDDYARLFDALFSSPASVPDAIRRLTEEVKKDPDNPDLRAALASAYVAELLNVPDGPQRGVVWMQASEQYDAALERDPEHWQSRFGKAFGISQAPAFLGMRPTAIKQFEELLEIQERKQSEGHFWHTYFQLGNLYKDAGNLDKAREVWRRGQRLFPDNEQMKEALEVSTKR